MSKTEAISLAYQIATLERPSDEILDLLAVQPFERALELLLVLRQSSGPVRSPLNFLRRAIEENWTPETLPERINRKVQSINQRHYERKGYDTETAREKARQDASEY